MLERYLARLTSGRPWNAAGAPGQNGLTRADVLTALGMTESTLGDSFGINLVLARYSGDELAVRDLKKRLPAVSWQLWWAFGCVGSTSRRRHDALAALAVVEWCSPLPVKTAGAKGRAGAVGVDPRTWSRTYAAHYDRVMQRMSDEEKPVLRQLYRVLSGEG